jgi:hypothetical protein
MDKLEIKQGSFIQQTQYDPLKFIFLCEFKLNTLLYLYKKDKFTKCLLQSRLVLTKNVQENIYTDHHLFLYCLLDNLFVY